MNNFFIRMTPNKMFLIIPLILLAFGFSARGDSFQSFSENPQWVLSLHYKSGWRKPKHATKTDGFYLSHEASAEKELRANIKAAKEDRNYQCRFPFRTKLLKRAKLLDAEDAFCPDLYNWKSAFDKQELSLAFASQYLSNPASVFGHTFLVFSPADRQEHPEYLDVTIGYAAEMPPKVGSLKYIVYGLGGGFQGRFFDEPFYQRLHEYSNMELRDLWQYPIKATSQQIDDLLDHIYELSHKNYFDYYFLDENCSYMLLQILEVVFPDSHLLKDFPLYVIPSETIKTLDKNRLLGTGKFIPSLRTKFLGEFKKLSKSEKSDVKNAISGDLSSLKSKASTDAVITYFDKKKFETKGNIDARDQELYQRLLIQRSKLGPQRDVAPITSSLDPVQGHHPFALTLSTGKRVGDRFQELELRPAVHDLLDLGNGQIKHSQIRLLTPALRLGEKGDVRLQRLQFFNLANIVPYHSLDPIYSWTLALEQDRLLDKICFNCSATRFRAEIGMSFKATSWLDYYVLPGVESLAGKDLKQGHRLGPGVHSGLLFDFDEKLKINPALSYYSADQIGKFRQFILRSRIEASYNLSPRLSFKMKFEDARAQHTAGDTQEASLAVAYFFR